MTTTVTATVKSGLRVAVSITDTAPIGTFTLYADDLSSPRRPVRGAVGRPSIASNVFDDVEAPLNRPVYYVVKFSSGIEAITATPVVLTSPLPVISDPVSGEHVEVTIVDWPQVVTQSRAVMIDIEGQRQRVRMFDLESSPSFPVLTVRTLTSADLVTMRRLHAGGAPLLLRGGRGGIEDCYIGQAGSRTEERITMRADDWRRNHPWKDVEQVPQPDPTDRATGGDTLGQLNNAAPTSLLQISQLWPTLGAIAVADLGDL